LDRTRQFALGVSRFCRTLPHTDEAREAARQLRRAANSVRSNYRASRKGRSRAEFEAKLGIVREEADECVDWLEYIHDLKVANRPELLQEARELAKIFTKALKTARQNTERVRSAPRS
jgi:four helix bundle protein